jgi:F0F1-type ATP synthase membrane subunit b/b'
MLEKEMVRHSEQAVREAGAEIEAGIAEAEVEVDGETREAAEDVAELVGDLVVGVSESVAAAKVRNMSSGKCIHELVRLRLGLESDDSGT